MTDSLESMIGLPGQGMHFGIDPLSALFFCILAPQVLAAAIAGMRGSIGFWVLVLGMAIALAGQDAFTLIFGLGLMSAASWLLILRGGRTPAGSFAALALLAAACLVQAVFLPASGMAFMLVLLGASAIAGLAPLLVWPPGASPPVEAGAGAVLSGGMVNIALYVLIRYAFGVFGAADAPWWGVVLIAAGTAGAVLGGVRVMVAVELTTLLAGATAQTVGLIAVGLGIALRAKALGDPMLAALALQAALLGAVAHGLCKPLLLLGAGAVQAATGTASLDWLGGLIRGMPKLGLLMLAGAAGMAALPLGPGFAPVFLLLHAVMAAAATGGIAARTGFAVVLAGLGLAAGLALAAAVRLIGIGFLGRPRSLRAAAAEEAPRAVLAGTALLAVLCTPLALLPGLLLAALQPVILRLMPGAVPPPLGYAPLPLAALMAMLAGAAFLLLRRFGARGRKNVPAFDGGFGKPPSWLPFGDPATQPTATGFAEPVRRALAGMILAGNSAGHIGSYLRLPRARLVRLTAGLAARGRVITRQPLGPVLVALVVLLLALR